MAANLNGKNPWSEKDLVNLERALARGYPIELIAGYLMRDAEEVRQMHEAVVAGSIRLQQPSHIQAFRAARRPRLPKTAA
jgi:hypothetical protein